MPKVGGQAMLAAMSNATLLDFFATDADRARPQRHRAYAKSGRPGDAGRDEYC